MAETHLQNSAELQNQSVAIQKELDNILQALQVPPAACRQPQPGTLSSGSCDATWQLRFLTAMLRLSWGHP